MAEKKRTEKAPASSKVLKELKKMNKILGEIKIILDNTWREISPK